MDNPRSSDELQRVSSVSDWYLNSQLNFDKRLVRFRYETIRPFLVGPFGLEVGSAAGEMTQFLVNDFEQLTVVEGSPNLLDEIPERPNQVKVNSLFEDFRPEQSYNSVVLEHILEHVDDPYALLNAAKDWLAPNGRMIIGVPNAFSIHRLAAVKMGLLQSATDLNERDYAVGHRRVYTPQSLIDTISRCGLTVIETGGVFLKPVSNKQIEDQWSEEMIQGFFLLGKDFPNHSAELYAVCTLPNLS